MSNCGDSTVLRGVISEVFVAARGRASHCGASMSWAAVEDVGRRERLLAALEKSLHWRHERRSENGESSTAEIAREIRSGINIMTW